MALNYFTKTYKNLSKDFEPRNNPVDLWKDLFTYSSNLNGNWLLSKRIFYDCIVPTAEKNPLQFAKWVKKMVEKSGMKIKSRAEFIEAINYLRKIKNTNNNEEVKIALYYLLDSGLEEPTYALRALNNNNV